MRRARTIVVLALALATVQPAAALAADCPSTVDPDGFASKTWLRKLNALEWRLSPRPTGSADHTRFIDALEREMEAIPGVRTRSIRYRINRWDASAVRLRLGSVNLPVAGPVPYAEPTSASGVTAPLVYLPTGTAITAANAAGRIVVRDPLPGRVALAVFGPDLLGVFNWDPGRTIDPGGRYERDFLANPQPELEAAGAAGAVGIIFMRDLPRSQQRGHYAPYEGLQWEVPGLYLGADESSRLRDAIAADRSATATITIRARRRPATTRTLLATLPGRRAQRLVVESHTDGVNAIWDNGPVSMVAMARYLARLPRRCRARTVQFAFVTGHLYQHLTGPVVRDGGAEQVAKRLDRDYDRGRVAGVVVLEHLGALEWERRPRADGPGQVLRRTGRSELVLIAVSRSAALRREVRRVLVRHDLRRHAVIDGADFPEPGTVPPRCSFGGEGGPYNKHLLPTVALIAAPATLFDPPFGLEGIDFRLMRRQTIGFTHLVRRLDGMKRNAIAGSVTKFRRQREAGAPTCPP
ncbi:MAG TPA: hypothetical protein VFQ12_00285 [Thermoleophilaceae bacterium]|nr:hypothetical protein [Thermoleophilaceae bacterium]